MFGMIGGMDLGDMDLEDLEISEEDMETIVSVFGDKDEVKNMLDEAMKNGQDANFEDATNMMNQFMNNQQNSAGGASQNGFSGFGSKRGKRSLPNFEDLTYFGVSAEKKREKRMSEGDMMDSEMGMDMMGMMKKKMMEKIIGMCPEIAETDQ